MKTNFNSTLHNEIISSQRYRSTGATVEKARFRFSDSFAAEEICPTSLVVENVQLLSDLSLLT